MEREIIKTRLSPVDILIHPRVEAYTAMDYDHAADFMRLGEEAAREAVDEIRQKLFAEGNQGV
jgi:predicted acylesterase/phospholipase RssA